MHGCTYMYVCIFACNFEWKCLFLYLLILVTMSVNCGMCVFPIRVAIERENYVAYFGRGSINIHV